MLPGVTVTQSSSLPVIANPAYCGDNLQASQTEFTSHAEGVGNFYACDGRKVEYTLESDADPDWVRLYLNGQVLVALLHQQKIINFHASSFIHDGRGVMVLGETGAGKSSLTASFALSGAGFLSDDLTPVRFIGGIPYIWPVYRKIKLRPDTVEQLGIGRESLREAEQWTGKQYLEIEQAEVNEYPLSIIVKIETGNCGNVEFYKPSAVDRFSLLRSEICSGEMLAGMPETEAEYLQQLVQILEKTVFIRVIRPSGIKVSELHAAVMARLDETDFKGWRR